MSDPFVTLENVVSSSVVASAVIVTRSWPAPPLPSQEFSRYRSNDMVTSVCDGIPVMGSDTVPLPNCPRKPRVPSAGAVAVVVSVQLPVTPFWKSSLTSVTSPPTTGA